MKARIIGCTALGADSEMLKKFQFPFVLGDEAAMLTEPATLVPLCKGAKFCVLVGDENQLTPCVFSEDAKNANLDVSLFVRISFKSK